MSSPAADTPDEVLVRGCLLFNRGYSVLSTLLSFFIRTSDTHLYVFVLIIPERPEQADNIVGHYYMGL